MKYYIGLIILFSFIHLNCSAGKETSDIPGEKIGETEIVLFKSAEDSSPDKVLQVEKRIKFYGESELSQVLDTIAYHLEKNIFYKWNEEVTGINFKVQDIIIYKTQNYNFRTGVINISDTSEYVVNYFSQGSTGGQHTYAKVISNLIQPQLPRPLLDGLIILYNGETLAGMDHINFEGIITPANAYRFVHMALKEEKR